MYYITTLRNYERYEKGQYFGESDGHVVEEPHLREARGVRRAAHERGRLAGAERLTERRRVEERELLGRDRQRNARRVELARRHSCTEQQHSYVHMSTTRRIAMNDEQ